jgi:hypothetical protein
MTQTGAKILEDSETQMPGALAPSPGPGPKSQATGGGGDVLYASSPANNRMYHSFSPTAQLHESASVMGTCGSPTLISNPEDISHIAGFRHLS